MIWVYQNYPALGSANISILSPYIFPEFLLEGQYTVLLNPGVGPGGGFVDASLAQFGQLPADAQSIQMKVLGSSEGFSASFGGQNVPLLPIGGNINYTLYAGDISNFACQTGELRLTGLTTPSRPNNAIFFDSIVFSPLPVPEPSRALLLLMGLPLLLLRRFTRAR